MNLLEQFPDQEFLIADGFDDAIIGVEHISGRVVYDIDAMIEILKREDMSYEDAIEHLQYNVFGSYVGENTPIYINQIK